MRRYPEVEQMPQRIALSTDFLMATRVCAEKNAVMSGG